MRKWCDKELAAYKYKARKLIKLNKKSKKKSHIVPFRNFSAQYNKKSFYSFIRTSNFSDNKKEKYIVNNDTTSIKIPKTFSLFSNPDEVLGILNKIYRISKDRSISELKFDHFECEDLELGASVLLDVFVMNALGHRKQFNKKLGLSGRYSNNTHVNVVLNVSGLVKTLNINENINEVIDSTHGIEKLDLILGGNNTKTLKVNTYIDSGTASTHLAEYFNNCLKTQGYKLGPAGMSQISEMVGEVIDNSTIHSGDDFSQWFLLANYFLVGEEEEYGECNIVMFNFGQTIYEGLHKRYGHPTNNYDATNKKMRDNLYKLSESHRKKGFFKQSWTEETLWTLYALQDGVSRCLSDEDPSRGTGTVKMIEAFQEIGSTIYGKVPEMCIISGKSHILFTDEYQLHNIKKGKENDDRQIIAFNEDNDLYSPPDANYVKTMSNYFPGTIISMKFYLDKKYIENLRGD